MAVGMVLLYDLVGPAAFGALGVMILVNILQSIVVPFLFKGFYAIKKITDARIKLLTEFLNGIRIIKLLTWEDKVSRLLFVVTHPLMSAVPLQFMCFLSRHHADLLLRYK